MKAIHPSLFTQLMRFPEHIRQELLEFLGATPVVDEQLRTMIAEVAQRIQDGGGEVSA